MMYSSTYTTPLWTKLRAVILCERLSDSIVEVRMQSSTCNADRYPIVFIRKGVWHIEEVPTEPFDLEVYGDKEGMHGLFRIT